MRIPYRAHEVVERKYNSGLCLPCSEKAALKDPEYQKHCEAEHRKALWIKWEEIEAATGFGELEIDENTPGFDTDSFYKVATWDETETPHLNLVIEGPPGVGKTRMMAFLAQYMINEQEEMLCEWITEGEFFELVGKLGKRDQQDEAKERMKELSNCTLLFFDDLGANSLTEARFSRLFRLLDERYRAGGGTIITTNWSPPVLASRIQRFFIKEGESHEEARTQAEKLLRRIYGSVEKPLADRVICSVPALRVSDSEGEEVMFRVIASDFVA